MLLAYGAWIKKKHQIETRKNSASCNNSYSNFSSFSSIVNCFHVVSYKCKIATWCTSRINFQHQSFSRPCWQTTNILLEIPSDMYYSLIPHNTIKRLVCNQYVFVAYGYFLLSPSSSIRKKVKSMKFISAKFLRLSQKSKA